MNTINFNDLPSDIKYLIFSKNRKEISNEIKKNKKKFLEVMDHIEEIIETTMQVYYDANEEEEIIDWSWGFGNAMLECIIEENNEYSYELQLEESIEKYYGLDN